MVNRISATAVIATNCRVQEEANRRSEWVPALPELIRVFARATLRFVGTLRRLRRLPKLGKLCTGGMQISLSPSAGRSVHSTSGTAQEQTGSRRMARSIRALACTVIRRTEQKTSME